MPVHRSGIAVSIPAVILVFALTALFLFTTPTAPRAVDELPAIDERVAAPALQPAAGPFVGATDQPAVDPADGALPITTSSGGFEKLTDAEAVYAAFDAGEERSRVIINLAPTDEVDAFADWDDAALAADHRARVAALVDAFLEELPPGAFELTRRYDNQVSVAGHILEWALELMLDQPAVDSIQPDELLRLNTRQGIPQIAATAPRATYGGAGVSVAIADTGIDYNHADMGGGGFPNAKVLGGWDFGDDDSNPMDQHGHGTSAAGVAAGDLNSQGDYIGGVAPSARLYALKISLGSSGSAYTSDMIAAWDWSLTHKNDDPANPILIVNTSFGDSVRYTASCNGANPAQSTSAANLVSGGIALFCSSGNDGYCDGICKPACISSAISVGALYDANLGALGWCVQSGSCVGLASGCSSGWQCNDYSTAIDQVTCYSNSASFLDLLAPSNDARVPTAGGGYTGFGGTSAASPYAAGAAAILQSAAMTNLGSPLSVAELKDLLIDNGVPVLDGKSGITKPRIHLEDTVNAVAPQNDLCSAPIVIADGATSFSNVGASTDGPSEPTACSDGGTADIESDVWYCYTAPCDGTVTVATCDADFDSMIAVYDGCACPSADSAIGCNDDGCAGDRSTLSFAAIGGDDYLIRVGGHLGAEGGGTLTVSCAPSNDDCASALTIVDGDTPFSNTGATTDGPDEPGLCNSSGDTQVLSDVWFSYTATCTGTVTIDLCSSDFDTKAAVYAGSSCPQSESALACNNNACGSRSIVEFDAIAGNDYLIRVGGSQGAQGTGTLSLSCETAFDSCLEAGVLTTGVTPFTTIGAATDGPDEPSGCFKNGDTQIGSDVWFLYTAECNGEVSVGLCDADFDTKVMVYAGAACPTSGNAIACDDDACGVQSEVTFMASAGNQYLVRLGGYQAQQGTGTLVVSCTPTSIDQCQGSDGVSALRVNLDSGGSSGHTLAVESGDVVFFDMAKPAAGGNGKFVVHMNAGMPTGSTMAELPAQIGTFCFEALLSSGAGPVAVWNNLGKEAQIGASEFFGDPIAKPAKAPTTFLFLASGDPVNLPPGSAFTLQGVIQNPDASSPKAVSVTNAILLLFE